MDQPSLFRRDVEQAQRLTTAFLSALADQAWHKGRDLAASLRTNERVLRQIASQSHGQVLSGQLGYRLTSAASNDEIDHAERWLLSQANKMKDRAREIRLARNRRGEAA